MFNETIDNEQIQIILNDILEVYGYDFLEYSHASIKRRITRLFSLDKFVSFAEFRYTIKNDKQYFKRFLEEITVNVTEMFRDPSFYRALRNDVLPTLGTYPFIRIWVAGCSTGEEAFSLAIVLKELNLLHKSLIYATDINPAVLEKAKKGLFSLNHLKQYSENYLQAEGTNDFSNYYIANYSLAKFDQALTSKMIFSTHNLVSDHSFNEFQLIMCRNVLIYFDKDLQHKVFNLFDNSIEKLGYLALGSKESLDFWPKIKDYKRVKTEKIWRKL
ncbi:protein-glutamate O-methyltransferase CheR [Pedobacter changchengzhani]|uniref:Protein-glutamate O-methyltransferase CheR n=1 Tax=Pedobacter changchengzhani TaxID=2529274 RepID=A0A4R5MNW2_9SPHI|nr:CheR family methyltransferase [Pedobacter changchengzhani]TDG37471.1 protein-glutamate O-methyltransferase CheR [Pedobacter changchengzhani]